MAKSKQKRHQSTPHSNHSSHHSTRRSKGRHTTHHGSKGTERMMAAGQEQFRRFQKSAGSGFDALGVFSGPMSRLMDQNWSVFQKTMQVVHEESLHFFNRRLEHTSHLMEESRDLQGISGLMKLQQHWMAEFARDVSEQATRITNRMRELAVDSAEYLAEASSDTLENEQELEEKYEKEERAEQRRRAEA